MNKKTSPLSKIYMVLIFLFLYAPIFVLVLYSFNANPGRQPIAFTGFSLRNYAALFQDTRGLVESLRTSLVLALMSVSAAIVIGTLGAVGMARRKFRFCGAGEYSV